MDRKRDSGSNIARDRVKDIGMDRKRDRGKVKWRDWRDVYREGRGSVGESARGMDRGIDGWRVSLKISGDCPFK
jgi:hypothetical protein